MSFIAHNPERHVGRVVGNGHCVAFTREAADMPHTSLWTRGMRVRGQTLARGTAIATFGASGKYENRTDGTSHVAILEGEEDNGLRVWDQWLGRAVGSRLIRFKGGSGLPVDDGDAYHVVETATT